MNWQFSPYTFPLFIAAAVNLLLALYAARSRNSPRLSAFTFLMWATAIWAFGYGFELASPTAADKLFWAKIQYLGIVAVPPAWLLLALQYTGRDIWLQRKRPLLFLLFLVPCITLLLAWTNETHGLIWAHTELIAYQNVRLLDYTYGRWFWANIAFSYLCLLLGTSFIIQKLLRAPGVFRRQTFWMLVAALLPWIGNALYLIGIAPFPRLDLTPFAFTLSGVAVIWGAFHSQFLDITPVAHSTIVMKLDEGILVLDAKDRIIDVNPAGQRIIGQSLTEIVGNMASLVFNDWPDWMTKINKDQRTEITFMLRGEPHIYELRVMPLMADDSDPQGKLLVLHDITAHKQQEIQLNEARIEAVAAAKAKSEFLANMSHEIRTPLNAVIGMTGLLRDSLLNAEQQDLVNTIFTSSDALLTIINNVLDFSKIDAGKLELENEPFDLEDCVLASLDLIKMKANEKGLQLSYQINSDTPQICKGDTLRLRQVLVNLLSNGVKFTDEGQINIHVTSKPISQAKHEVTFAIRDTGIGIPADKIGFIFQSFSQADTSHTRKYGGTGLGLAISQRLVELMGGKIWVQSEVGQGATFFFTIPTEIASTEPKRYLHEKQLKLPGKRVLFVSAHSSIRRTMSRQVRTWGMHPYVAGSPSEVIYWLQNSTPFDVIIVDEEMLDAADTLLIEIRQLTPGVPLLLLTRQETLPTQIQAAITTSARKPIKPSALYEVLVKALSIQKSQELAAKTGGKTAVSLPSPTTNATQQPHLLRILLAEDNLINQKVATRIMTKLGYKPDVVNNGREVLTALEKETYQIIFMDVQMPEMDGVEATQCIHTQWPAEKRPWIIAMTAHALEGDKERYLSAGMDDYISKPVRIEDMVESIHRYQQRQRNE